MSQAYQHLEPRPFPRLVSLVVPAYNEEAVLPLLRDAVTRFMATLGTEVEVIIVNDGSTDATLPMLLTWAADDTRVKVLGLARNFGHQAAVTAGLDVAMGDAVVVLDADLQDPLDVVPDMLREYRKGYDVVYGQRVSREGETRFKRATAWVFYRLMRRFVHRDLPPDTGDFRMMSRPCLDALRSMRETHRFLRGMVAWVGFPQTAVPFRRLARPAGHTKYPLHKMAKFAWTAAISFSPLPLRASLGLGLGTALFGLGYGVYAVVLPLLGGYTVRGWSSSVALMCLIGGMILISIGILGEYVGRIFEESKGRPLYIVSTRANAPGPTVGLSAAQSAELPRSDARGNPPGRALAANAPPALAGPEGPGS